MSLESIISGATAAAEASGTTGDSGGAGAEAVDNIGFGGGDSTPATDDGGAVADAPIGAGTEPPAAEEPPADAAPTEPKEEDVVELTAEELAGKMIPVNRHKAVLTKTRNELEQARQELGFLKTPETLEKLQAIDIAEQNPELFAQVLLADERFQSIFAKHFGSATPSAPTGAAPPAADAAAELGARPEADVLLPNGSVGYSADTMAKLLAYESKQQETRFQKALDERFGPVGELLQDREASRIVADATRRQTAIVESARQKWPKFKESELQIRDYLTKNQTATLEEAYREVVVPTLQSDRDKMRADLLKEINQRPAAAVRAPGQVTPNPSAGGARSIEQVIAEATARAEGK